MAQVYKVEMKQTVTAFIKADSEEQLLDWMNEHTPGEVDRNYTTDDVEYEDNIICPVDGYENFSIATED